MEEFYAARYGIRVTLEKDHSYRVSSELKEARLEARKPLRTHFLYILHRSENVQKW